MAVLQQVIRRRRGGSAGLLVLVASCGVLLLVGSTVVVVVGAFSPSPLSLPTSSLRSHRRTFAANPLGATAATTATKTKTVFIDGEAGTTGLQVRERLAGRSDLKVLSIDDDKRKDENERKRLINEADAVILCLPDAASIEAASWVEPDNDRTVLIDASTAFRVDKDWVYGFPELSKEQRTALESAKRIANPGCYPTGFIGLTRPLVDAGILPPGTPVTVNAISGYTGGGKQLMQIYENEQHEPWGTYGLTLAHKHVPEMSVYSGLGTMPIFQPAVATFAQGMVVSVPLHYSQLKPGTTGKDIHEAYLQHYKGSQFVQVMPLGYDACKEAGLLERGAFLAPDALANTNLLQLFVFPNDDAQQVLLCARLDNLGKGASGAAVQNLNIALGLDEATGLL